MRGCGLPGFAGSRRLEKVSAAMLQHKKTITLSCERCMNKRYFSDPISTDLRMIGKYKFFHLKKNFLQFIELMRLRKF